MELGTEANEVAPEGCIRIGMRLAIKLVKVEDGSIVFRVVRGVVIHGDEKISVTGGGVVRKDGTFAIKLKGDGLKLKAVGRAIKWRGSSLVLMRGRMTLNGSDEYAFRMKGRVFKLRPFRPKAKPTPEETEPVKPP